MATTFVRDRVDEAIALAGRVTEKAEALNAAYESERASYQTWQAALTSFEQTIDSQVMAADFMANTDKTGPLAGIARTSDAYKVAVKVLRSDLAANEFRDEFDLVKRLERMHQVAAVGYEQAKIEYSAVKMVCELQSAALRALAA